jgi:hypothetical protein
MASLSFLHLVSKQVTAAGHMSALGSIVELQLPPEPTGEPPAWPLELPPLEFPPLPLLPAELALAPAVELAPAPPP